MHTSTMPVFDAAQLRRRTGGSESLQVEMLSLFVAEVERLMRQIEDASDAQVRAERLRALVGLARNVGASMLAQEARILETHIGDAGLDLGPLRSAVATTLAYVRQSGV